MDKENVIHAVETAFELWIDEYTGCSWFKEDEVRQAKDDAISLLKEQEAVKPIPYHRSDGTIFKYECRQCRTKIFKMDLFCRHCGRSVKWE